jgi:hypothetical protein
VGRVQERAAVAREAKLEHIRQQVASGALVIRQMTRAERVKWTKQRAMPFSATGVNAPTGFSSSRNRGDHAPCRALTSGATADSPPPGLPVRKSSVADLPWCCRAGKTQGARASASGFGRAVRPDPRRSSAGLSQSDYSGRASASASWDGNERGEGNTVCAAYFFGGLTPDFVQRPRTAST